MDWEDKKLIRLTVQRNAAQYLKRPMLKEIIETNNKEIIKNAIEYIYSKSNCMFQPCQFLYQRLYEIEHSEVTLEIKNTVFDFSEFDKSIELSNKTEILIRERMSELKNKK